MRMKHLLLTIIALLAFMNSPAHAKETLILFTGNKLYSVCQGKIPNSRLLCNSYIMGVSDSLSSIGTIDKFASIMPSYCPPKEGNLAQIVDVVVDYLKANPAVRHEPASD